MLELSIVVTGALIFTIFRGFYHTFVLKPFTNQSPSRDDFCVIDIRDYISAHRSPYPGAENIPLSYLQRALKDRFQCTKDILLVTDDKRGAKLAARMIRKKKGKNIYYVKAV
ncbi:rhodanese-like domain-containing protein [Halobacillus sp. A5]|uniref:rhodanese-like domain-containing protein n=1 Tax=Halobacillus sp. A5 TaxID=2880263 RepID=UPI0020A64750|nr:rhodanese-like domain-containing protein [Halobacillus sp. A5]MCP3028318.1 rhodanese-like domain-containing protein [Halobacillus sp. A5]